MKTYKGLIRKLEKNQALLFGGNPEFRHGKGNALLAVKIAGAKYGKGGAQGRSYCIITKDLKKRKHPSIPKEFIIEQIGKFYEFANRFWNIDWLIPYTIKGNYNCGYTSQEMADMFSQFPIPENIVFEEQFSKLLTWKNI